MGLLRSETMKHGTVVLPVDSAKKFVDVIGTSTKMQFEDMHSKDGHRPYKKYVQRIDEMERILRFLVDELKRVPGAEVVKNNTETFLDYAGEYKLDEVEARLSKMYKDFTQFKTNNAQLTAKRNAALEERYVVQTAIASMAQQGGGGGNISGGSNAQTVGRGEEDFQTQASEHLLSSNRGLETVFSTMAGVLPQVDQDRFARTLFRATRGNTFTHFQQIFEPIIDPSSGAEVQKAVFVVYFQDNRAGAITSAMADKISKICNSFGVNTYGWPSSRANAEERKRSLDTQVQDQGHLLQAHENFVRSEVATLLEPAHLMGNSLIEDWRLFCIKEKSSYATLNLFEGDMNLRANCWYPQSEEDKIRAVLVRNFADGRSQTGAMLVPDRKPPRKSPPTYIRKNEFTGVFQELVDTYGLPRYQEANPALFAVVTFPFLFGIMFGDVGHGLMLFSIGAYCVWKADELRYGMPLLYEARYILFMMGLFAVYCGFLYNDFFSLGFSFFESQWVKDDAASTQTLVKYTYAPGFNHKNEVDGGRGPYPFGIDSNWHGAQNELIYMNSLKMKMSVCLGVAQMTLGIFLRFANAFYFNSMTDVLCECVPMLMFMVCFFGYMDYLILTKWVGITGDVNIINALIDMAFFSSTEQAPFILMILSVLCIPWLLIPKPIIEYMQHKAKPVRPSVRAGEADEEGGGADDEEEEFDISEVAIHQVIETIEYVLGTVSHTASYLRLWALSLAHQQLSVVFLQMTLEIGLEMSFPFNVLGIYFTFAVWFVITVAILLGMDVLECFLHTLRLHWVEFQSKFYKADGYAFEPYNPRALFDAGE